MLDEPIEDVYFNWLYVKVAAVDVPTPSLTYWNLFRDLHAIEFVWLVSGDDNRVEDGLEVRKTFLRQSYLPQDPPWLGIPCSVLEMLIAFSHRAAFETAPNQDAREWFWIFLENLGLRDCNDAMPASQTGRKIAEVMDRFIWRTYSFNGQGGMFPLKNPQHDQRKVEIWYQYCEYLVDHEYI